MTESATALPEAENLLLQELDMVESAVEVASATLASGNFVDMTGLDRAVADLCAAATALPPIHRRRAAQKLSRLAVDLTALAEALTLQRVQIERASEAEARHRAADAYPANLTR
ncbi:MAG TPA: hypothetical protein VLX09_12360 [Stellaceae bacterium]|nr:hypothetical protein [Stellaceae bacterium]